MVGDLAMEILGGARDSRTTVLVLITVRQGAAQRRYATRGATSSARTVRCATARAARTWSVPVLFSVVGRAAASIATLILQRDEEQRIAGPRSAEGLPEGAGKYVPALK